MKLKNRYLFCDDGLVKMLIDYKGKTFEVLLDSSDFDKVKNYKWFLTPYNKSSDLLRVRANVYLGKINGVKKNTSIYLHRLLLDPPKHLEVDHINNNPLDNRRSNLRIVNRSQNQQNKIGARKDNLSSGIRNVYFDKQLGKYKVVYRLNGKNHHVGVFEDIREAEKVAQEIRRKYMPYSKESM
jgi:HNH endonuclease